ncbi:hypothetical protein [Ruania alba]|uniref:ABC transporter permease n=1 Tax=Ruania alba TaxID=648782 RepID=A0A1H5KD80_9MICO|nr:hypothetical protein [Ruania alba]SEE62753.1 hypothetical protein SAMN04488554_2203 [Ruania alba]
MAEHSTHPSGERSAWPRAIAVPLALVLVASVVVLALVWPARTAEPRDVPIAIVGPEQAVMGVQSALAEHGDGAFRADQMPDRDAALAAIRNRESYGAILLGERPEVLTASAASSAIATALAGMAPTLQAQAQQAAQAQADAAGVEAPEVEVTVTDVVPLADTDPRGAALALASLPLLIVGLLGGIVIGLLSASMGRRLLGVAIYAVGAGLLLPAILGPWLGIVHGDYLTNMGAFTLILAAISATLAGLIAVLGPRGAGLGVVLLVVIANPISSAAMPVEFLPGPWGEVGQWFPPGAAATLVRSLSYFPEAAIGGPVAVLAGWLAVGLVLVTAGSVRHRAG